MAIGEHRQPVTSAAAQNSQPQKRLQFKLVPQQQRDAVLVVGAALLTALISNQGVLIHKQVSDPQTKSKRPKPSTSMPVNSCTALRRHGRITHQPEDVLDGGFGPELPCCPPLSTLHRGLKSMTEELEGPVSTRVGVPHWRIPSVGESMTAKSDAKAVQHHPSTHTQRRKSRH